MSEEPRLAKKSLGPLCNIIQTTPAKSLMYECINTCTVALSYIRTIEGEISANLLRVVNLCTEKLQSFLSDPDQNLKYLGLVGLSSMMASYPTAVGKYRVILGCLQDEDMTIRLRALNLLCGMINSRNIVEVVRKLMKNFGASDDVYRDAVVEKILYVCSKDRYAYVNDFAWYISVLIDLISVNNGAFGTPIASQLLDICMRVSSVRRFAAIELTHAFTDGRLLSGPIGEGRRGMVNLLVAASFIVGEYSSFLFVGDEKSSGDEALSGITPVSQCKILLETLLSARTLALPPVVQASFVHTSMKIISIFLQMFSKIYEMGDITRKALALSVSFASSSHMLKCMREVQL